MPHTDNPAAREKQLLSSMNVPIRFFGRIVDESGSPVAGAGVACAIRSAPLALWTSGKDSPGSCASSKDGTFSISGRGESLSIKSILKPGFSEPKLRNYGFHYAPDVTPAAIHKPDNSNPVEFLVISGENATKTARIHQTLSFKWNGEPHSFDLGQKIGTITLTCQRQPLEENQQSEFRWNVNIGCRGFGIIEHMEGPAVSPIAPEVGYQPSVRYQAAVSGAPWSDFGEKSFFLKTNDGNYGVVSLRIYTAREDDSVNGSIVIYLNDGTSRVVDHD